MVLIGVAGGSLGELLKWFRTRDDLHKGLPDWSKSCWYWLVTVLMALTGGLLVFGYVWDGNRLGFLLCLDIGVSAPLLLGKLLEQTPASPGSID